MSIFYAYSSSKFYSDEVMIPTTYKKVPLFKSHNSYHVNVYVGSPPQRRLVILDTGSRYLVFPCKPCYKCGITHFSKDHFDPSYSTTDLTNKCLSHECTFQNKQKCNPDRNQCEFAQIYAEGSSIGGFEVEDIVWFGTDNEEQSIKIYMQYAVPMSFGCQNVETGLIARQHADGIMGLIEHERNAVFEKMVKEGVLNYHAFSICMTREGGILSLGGTSLLRQHVEPMQMEPRFDTRFYSILVNQVFLGELEIASHDKVKSAFSSGKKSVIDSGTTDTFLPIALHDDFAKVWFVLTGKFYNNQVHTITYDFFQNLPKLTIVLSSGYHWIIEPHAYMEESLTLSNNTSRMIDPRNEKEWPANGANFVNRLYWDESEGAVFGSNSMLNHDILFDLENNQIGFARSRCKEFL